MEFLDPRKKRINEIRLLFGYLLVAIMLALAAIIVLFQVYGYDVDRKTGNVIQNGLIFLDSHPESAGIYINGEYNNTNTGAKLALPGGSYNVELRRDGYTSWTHKVELQGGGVERFVYPMIFPLNLETSDINTFSTKPAFYTSSPDRQWLLVQRPGRNNVFDSFNLNNVEEPSSEVTVPEIVLTSPPGKQSFELVEWSTDNRHVLLKHNFVGGSEFIVVDRQQPGESFNVNKLVGNNPTSVTLRDKKFDRYYVYYARNKTLQSFDVGSTQPEPLLTDVINYKSHGDNTILYSTSSDEQPNSGTIKIKDGDQTYTIHTYKDQKQFLLNIARFDNAWYVAVSAVKSGVTYIFINPQDNSRRNPDGIALPSAALSLKNPKYLTFSENTRIIAVQSANKFAVYDNETGETHNYQFNEKVGSDQQAKWMDGHRMTLVIDAKSVVFDFDGTNYQWLSPAYGGSQLFFDRDYTGLYNIAPATGSKQAALTRTELIVNP